MNDASARPKVHGLLWQILRLAGFGLPLLAVAIYYGRSLGHDWKEFEGWIAEIGFWGPLVLIVATVILIVAMFPDTPLSMAAGAIFGMGWGSFYAVTGALLGASAAFWLSRLFLHERIQRFLTKHPRWAAVEAATSREGLRLQFLIRLTPMHSATLSYVMGASRLSFRAFAIGSLGMIPGVVGEVYVGHVAGHAARLVAGTGGYSLWHTLATVGGLVLFLGVMGYITVIARRAVAASEAEAVAQIEGSIADGNA